MKPVVIIAILWVFSYAALSSDQQSEDENNQTIFTQTINYEVDYTKLTGFLAYDKTMNTKRPGVLVVHEWWGHNNYARKRAVMLAELGYIAFAVDMYGDGKLAKYPADAGKFMNEVTSNMSFAEKRLDAALQILIKQPLVDADNIAAIGYCFGGAMVLHLARSGVEIDGVVSFHGSLATQSPAQKGDVKTKVLVFNGKDDPFVLRSQVHEFLEEMNAADVDFEFVDYPNAKHSFTNSMADKYNEEFDLPVLEYNLLADEDSWERMQEYFIQIFK